MLNKAILMKESSLDLRKIIILTVVTSIFFLALVMRMGMVNQTEMPYPIRNDAKEYYSYAINFITTGIYSNKYPLKIPPEHLTPNQRRPPGYPLFLMPFVEYPPNLSMVKKITSAQAVISSFTVLLCFFLFRLFLTTSLAILGMLFVAISPHLIAMDIYILTESLFTFFLVSLAYCMSKLILKPDKRWAYILGVILGISLLIKPTMIYFIFFLFFGMFFLIPNKDYKKLIFIILIGYLTSYGPWVIYKNIALGEKPSSLSLASLHNGMYIGLMHNNDPKTRAIPHRADPDYNKIGNMSALLTKLSTRFQEQPVDYLKWYLVDKTIMFFSWSTIAGVGDIFIYQIFHSPYQTLGLYQVTHKAMRYLHEVFMIMGCIMALVLWLPVTKSYLSKNTLLVGRMLSIIIFYFIAVHIAGTPLPRYSIPLRPIMYALALLSILFLYNIAKKNVEK